MIINYGAFISQTLDKNYLPVILKYLELYVLTYGLDDVLAELSKNTNKHFTKAGSGKSFKIIAENENISESDIIELDKIEIVNGDFLNEQSGVKNRPPQPATTQATAPRQPRPITTGTSEGKAKKPAVKTDTGVLDRNVLSVEPTWIKVTYGDNVFIFGVKVLPVYVKNDNVLIEEMMKDSKNGFLKLFVKSISRTLTRLGTHIYQSTIGNLPFLGAEPPKGIKVKKQIVNASSTLRKHLFIIMNKNNIDPEFLNDAGSLNDMFQYLKWCSMVFVDDVNQQVSFCMKINSGMCNIIPYRVLIYSAGKYTGAAYQEIDEIQNAVSSVFKMKKSKFTKMLGEMRAANKMIGLQQHLTEGFLQENTEKYLSNPNLAIDMYKKIRFIAKNSSFEEIQKKMASYPYMTIKEVDKYIIKNSEYFDKKQKYAKTVLKNSLDNDEISDNDLDVISYILAYRISNMRGRNQMKRLVESLKNFIYKFRSNYRQIPKLKLVLFRTTVDVFDSNTSILSYHDLDDDTERQEIILKNLYVFLVLIPLLTINEK